MHAYFAFRFVGYGRRHHALHQLRLRSPDSVGKRDACDSEIADELRRFRDLLFVPRIAVWITERQRNVSDHLQARVSRARVDRLQDRAIFLQRLILVPAQKRFRVAQRFDIVAKPGLTQTNSLEDLTAVTAPDGDLALIEFTGALPRVKLYSNWQVNTNDTENLKTLADPNFDPVKTVLISTPQKDLPAISTNENSGTVEFKSYATKRIIFTANATAPSVLLLNDKFDPNWRVTVDGKPAELLRCNFIMRGVQLSPGQHTVQFDFSMPNHPLFITLAAIIIALFIAALLVFMTRKPQTSAAK